MKSIIYLGMALWVFVCVAETNDPKDRSLDPWSMSLRNALQPVTRIEVVSGQVLLEKDEAGAVCEIYDQLLFKTSDISTINALVESVSIHVDKSNFRCMCGGHPIVHFYSGDVKIAVVGYHHGRSLRWQDGAWPDDALLTDESAILLNGWFAEYGIVGPKDEWEQRKRDQEQERRAKAAVPPFLSDYFLGKRWDDFSENETREMDQLLVAQYPETHIRILFLLDWYGAAGGSWSSSYSSEKAALNLLARYGPNEIEGAIHGVELSATQLEGLARLCSGSFGRVISPELRARLLEYGLRSDDRYKRFAARNAFGEFEYEEIYSRGSLSLINAVTAYHGTDATLTFPDSIEDVPVTIIRASALTAHVKRIILPATVTNISECVSHPLEAMDVSPDNPVYSSENGVLLNKEKTKLIKYPTGRRGAVELPSSVTRIGEAAFSGCNLLTEIHVPGSVTTIEKDAFRSCVAITNITLPVSVTHIGEYAFADCPAITELSIPGCVATLSEGLFYQCTDLRAVELPRGLINIASEVFAECRNLKRIELPNGMTNIADSAFWGCEQLQEVEIPESVQSMAGAFIHCRRLQNFVVHPLNPNYRDDGGVLLTKDGKTLVQYPGGRTGTAVLPDGFSSIQYDAFHGCSELTSISIPEGVTHVGPRAFYACAKLKRVSLSNSVSVLGGCAFRYCEKLEEVMLSERCVEIEDGLFENCIALSEIIIPENVVKIHECAFWGCTALRKIYFEGDRPDMVDSVFHPEVTFYYREGREGWGEDKVGGWATKVWNADES